MIKDIKFKPGQLWKYKTRRGEEHSRVLILKVETFKNEKIVHVTVIGEEFSEPIHMPFSEFSVKESVTSLCANSYELPDYEEGYLYWKLQLEEGNAGIYGVTVAEALDM